MEAESEVAPASVFYEGVFYEGAEFHLRGGGNVLADKNSEIRIWLDEVRSDHTVEDLQLYDFVPGGEKTNLVATADGENVYYLCKRWPILDPGPVSDCPWTRPRCTISKNFYSPLFKPTSVRYKGMRVA